MSLFGMNVYRSPVPLVRVVYKVEKVPIPKRRKRYRVVKSTEEVAYVFGKGAGFGAGGLVLSAGQFEALAAMTSSAQKANSQEQP